MARKTMTEEERRFNVRLGQRVERMRKERGYSGIAMARALGIVYNQLYCYECGQNRLPPYMLNRIAAQLGVRLADLFPEETSNLRELHT